MEATTYASLAVALAPAWRVIALDQRGHGYSSHGRSYTRNDYLGDVAALYSHLGIERAVLLGNSLGGVNAYQFAARHPERVDALVIEDIGAVVADDASFVLAWRGTAPSRDALAERIGPQLLPYIEGSFRETSKGWTLAFDPQDIVISQQMLNGDHWADWLATDCPTLLIHGRKSPITTASAVEEMEMRRPHTQLVTLDGGHVVHVDNPIGFTDAVRTFLQGLL